MAVVYSREIDGEAVTFGTTGYTLNHVFVLYDRATQSVWYPLGDKALDAVSGPRMGEKIEFIEKPERMTLAQWRELHPDTKVLLPPIPERGSRPRPSRLPRADGNGGV